ncbi:MAG: hypothetical protein JW965_00685 [Bacteroidales bacterium]|nr:hypothetical protein [Bacteroidales bacterium]
MERILIFIKHHFGFLWRIIEWVNGFIFSLFFKSRLNSVISGVLSEISGSSYLFRRLDLSDTESLHTMIKNQDISDLEYFSPHGFDLVSIKRQFKNRSFLMMGVFEGEKMVGYFFLRFFINRKCFVGRLIDKQYRGMGIGLVMNDIMYETSWRMGFRCLSTISKKNKSVMKAHAKNPTMRVLKELQNDYLLVEFVRFARNSIPGESPDNGNQKNEL